MKILIIGFILFVAYIIHRIRKENKRIPGVPFITDEQLERARMDMRVREAQEILNQQ